MPFLHSNSSFEGTSYKNLQDSHQLTSSFISYCFTLAFTSAADIIFHNFLELHSALSEKRFVTHFFF